MIQRIQSLYLILAIAALVALLFTGLVHSNGNWTRWGTLGFAIPAVVGAVVALFMFKIRDRQRRLIVYVQVSTILAVIALYGSLYMRQELYVRTVEGLDVPRLVVLLLPLVAYLLMILARRGVKKDIDLIRSMDRLR